MKLEKGMYVRTSKGKIRKFEGNNSMARVPFIIKCSYNIIDLIEVGDYVNGYLVTDVYRPDGNEVFRIEIERDTLRGHIIDKSSQIKSIVTKKQFESMTYEVEE